MPLQIPWVQLYMYKILFSLLILFSLFSAGVCAQSSSIWTLIPVEKANAAPGLPDRYEPGGSQNFELDLARLQSLLATAPQRGTQNKTNAAVILFPSSDGQLKRYKVLESPVMHPDLARRYPGIKTYCAQGIDDPTATMRFSITQYGLHAIIFSGNAATTYINPSSGNLQFYSVYDKSAVTAREEMPCLLDEAPEHAAQLFRSPPASSNANDQKLRTYRLALSCTAEFGNFFAQTPGMEKADILAAMAVILNRVNGIFERDMAISMQMVANNDTLLSYGNPALDPWPDAMNSNKTAENHDAIIGVDNYDIGHNFNDYTGGSGGCIACVCTSQNVGGLHKGRGYTGISTAAGALADPFVVDLVCHEMGHQFGGLHTMNRCTRFPNSPGPEYVEPGSGNTIMGYAQTCYPHVQPFSDDEFHYVNIQAITDNVQNGYGSTCGMITPLENHPPTADAGKDYIIPKSTAFVLEGTATDVDSLKSHTYAWAEDDSEESPSEYEPKSTYTVGPLYRYFKAVSRPQRYMPRLNDLVANNLTPTWEVTPSVPRTLKFSFLVRDCDMEGGQTASDVMQITVDSSGPFSVISQQTPSTWIAGTNVKIAWEVAGTDKSAVNTPAVDIFLSLDGGFTYPITLASHVPNNGSATAILPEGITTTSGRVMVRGAENIFFALNRSNITIQAPEFNLSIVDTTQSVCTPGTAIFHFNYLAFQDFQDTTTFSVSGLPPGCTAVFDPPHAALPNTPVQLIISGLTASMVGNYPLTLKGTSNALNYNASVLLHVLMSVPAAVVAVDPVQGAEDIAMPVTLHWNVSTDVGTRYDIQVAADPDFNNLLASASGLSLSSFTMPDAQPLSYYYWRVRAYNLCDTADFSQVFAFKTGTCNTLNSTNVPVIIPEIVNAGYTATSELYIPFGGKVTDVNVVGLHGKHTWINDLTVSLSSPQNTIVALWTKVCGNQDNYDLNLDDDAAPVPLPCPPTGGGTYRPQMPLSTYQGEDAKGIWTLKVLDSSNPNGGTIDGWGLQICTETPAVFTTTPEGNLPSFAIYPNPGYGLYSLTTVAEIAERCEVRILNAIGQEISTFQHQTGTTQLLDLRAFPAGLYWVNLICKKGAETRLIVNQ